MNESEKEKEVIAAEGGGAVGRLLQAAASSKAQDLIAGLQSSSASERAECARGLGELADSSTAAMLRSLKQRVSPAAYGRTANFLVKRLLPYIETVAIKILSRYAAGLPPSIVNIAVRGVKRAAGPVVDAAVHHIVPTVYDQAVDLALKLRMPAAGPLAHALRDDSAEVRLAAADALGRMGSAIGVEPLARALERDDSAEVRAQCARSLATIGGEDAKAALAEASGDERNRKALLAVKESLALLEEKSST